VEEILARLLDDDPGKKVVDVAIESTDGGKMDVLLSFGCRFDFCFSALESVDVCVVIVVVAPVATLLPPPRMCSRTVYSILE